MEFTCTRSDELYHHGILGQKWGVRRYQNPDGSYTAVGRRRYASLERSEQKASSSKSNLAKQYHNYNAATKRAEIERANKVLNAKGLKNKYSEAYGFGAVATNAKARAEYQSKNSELAKTRYGRNLNRAGAFNNEQLAKYASKMQKASTSKKIVEYVTQSEYMRMPVQTISGRKSTRGKEMVLSILTAGYGNLVLDSRYSSKLHKEANNVYKEDKKNAKTKYQDSVNSGVDSKVAKDEYKSSIEKAKDKYKRSF